MSAASTTRSKPTRPHERLARAAGWAGRLLALALVLVPASAQAQDEGDLQAPPPQINKEGAYSGVTPGQNPLKQPRRPNILSWVGFQPQEGGRSRLFVQLTSEVPYTQAVKDGAVYVMLEGVKYRNRNARRRLDMRFFDSSMQMVTSRIVKKRRANKGQPAQPGGIELKIQFKNPGDVRPGNASLSAGEDGYYYLFLDFPASSGSGSISVSEPE